MAHIQGTLGNDLITGTAHNDVIGGWDGHDIIDGGDGKDLIAGGRGTDWLKGGTGDDHLEGGDDADTLDGGIGFDTAVYALSPGGVNVSLMTGLGSGSEAQGDRLYNIEAIRGSNFNDWLEGDNNTNELNGRGGNDILSGLGGDDWLHGEDGNDTIYGGEGADTMTGGTGKDIMDGGNGNDLLAGGTGADTLTGGAGRDIFQFYNSSDSYWSIAFDGSRTHDVITDFRYVPMPIINQPPVGLGLGWSRVPTGIDPNQDVVVGKTAKTGNDTIDFSYIDANAGLAGDQDFAFIGTNGFTYGVAGQVSIATTSNGTWVYGEANGDALADVAVFLEGFTATSNLMNGDFLIL